MKKPLFVLALALLSCLLNVPPAAAQQLEQPDMDAVPDKPAWMEYKNPYVGEQNDLSNPHRSSDEVIAWGRDMATDALTFTAETFTAKLEELRPSFSNAGWTDYGTYMRDSRFLDMVGQKKYNAATIVDGDIALKGSGTVAGAYRWLLDIPLMITFHEITPAGETKVVTSGNFILSMQIGRVEPGKGKDGMVVDTWRMAATARRAQ